VENATTDDIQKMGELVEEMIKALNEDRIKEYSELDMNFHHQIANASHNRFMVHMFVTIRGLMEQFIREAFTVIPGLLERSLTFHSDIYVGIKERNQRKASASMKNHIQDIEQAFRDFYSTSE
jgi:GntR family transcriptional repressor for pyruvate dehydrogenase complex